MYVRVYNSSGKYRELFKQSSFTFVPVSSSSTPATAYSNQNWDLNATDFDFSSGNYLVVRLEQINQPGTKWESNRIKVTKSPTYTIIQDQATYQCGANTPITFAISSNAPNNQYQWGYDSSWLLNSSSTTSNTITLTPNTYPLGYINVTPTYNGVVQPYQVASVSLAPFTNSIAITGNNAICPSTSAVYGMSNLGSGSTVSWSTSNTSIATVTSTSGNQTTVNPIASQGTFNLIAVITNACGQQKTLTKTLTIGQPMFQINYVSRDLAVDVTLSPDYGSAALAEQGVDINTVSWNKIAEEGGNVYFRGDGLTGTVLFPNYNSSVIINVSLTNSCGTTTHPVVLMPGYADSRMGNIRPSISKTSNDLYEVMNVPVDVNKVKVSVYDIYGSLIFKTNMTSQINLSGLKAGIYIIKTEVKDEIITLKIVKN
jgi:hypothetical protein